MPRKILATAFIMAVFVLPALVGCGDSKKDSKQPQIQGPPDPRIKGPATPGPAPAGPKPAELK